MDGGGTKYGTTRLFVYLYINSINKFLKKTNKL